MARMHKVVEVKDGKSITVHELTVKQIISLLNDDALGDKKDLGIGSMQAFLKRHLSNATDLETEDMLSMAPSELKLVYDAFAEVNAVFFDTARSVGLETLLTELKNAMVEDFSKLLAGSLKMDM